MFEKLQRVKFIGSADDCGIHMLPQTVIGKQGLIERTVRNNTHAIVNIETDDTNKQKILVPVTLLEGVYKR